MSAMLGFFRIDGGVVVPLSDLFFGVRRARDVDDDGEDGRDVVSHDLELTENGPYRHVSSQCFSQLMVCGDTVFNPKRNFDHVLHDEFSNLATVLWRFHDE